MCCNLLTASLCCSSERHSSVPPCRPSQQQHQCQLLLCQAHQQRDLAEVRHPRIQHVEEQLGGEHHHVARLQGAWRGSKLDGYHSYKPA